MATEVNLKIPLTAQKYYNDVQSKANIEKVKSLIRVKYGKFIDNSSKISNVPAEIIEGFIFVESAGEENIDTGAIGLMQVGTATASDCLITEKGADRLSNEEAKLLEKYLGDRYLLIKTAKPKAKSIGQTFIKKADLLKPEFNILVGTILLKQLMDEFTENGVVRLDKVIVVYNAGRYSPLTKLAIAHKGNTDELISKMPKVTADYIRKIAGVNGLIDSLV